MSDGKICLRESALNGGSLSSCQMLEGCAELVYIRLRTLEAVASFRFLERALNVMARYDLLVFAMASSAGSFSVVAGAASAESLAELHRELTSFADVKMVCGVEVIGVEGEPGCKDEMPERALLGLLKDIPLLMVSSEEETGCVLLTVRRKDRERVIRLFPEIGF